MKTILKNVFETALFILLVIVTFIAGPFIGIYGAVKEMIDWYVDWYKFVRDYVLGRRKL